MARYTSGKYAYGICDRCGDKIPYKKLKKEWTGFKVCNNCYDEKTEQEFPTNFAVDPEVLKGPRSDNDKEAGIGLTSIVDNVNGETPIGKSFDQNKTDITLGTPTVVIT